MDLLIGVVIGVFIITAVFVGYHASQESHEKMAEGHGLTELDILSNQAKQTMQVLDIKAIQD